VTRARHHGRLVLVTLAVVGIGGACAPDTPPVTTSRPEARLAGYATMHDTMPEAIHRAKHEAVERPAEEVSRSRSIEALASQLVRIPGTNDAWLDFELHRRVDGAHTAVTETVTMLMNCNADSLVVLDHRAQAITHPLVLPPGVTMVFRDGHARVRVYGLRPMKRGQRSETLLRTAYGGDLVMRTALIPN
jgi:hypothetical protein